MANVTGTAANLASGATAFKAGDKLTITGSATMAQLNTIRAKAPASIAAATVTDTTVNANDLNLLDAITTGLINATAATTITGLASQVATALNSVGISTKPNIAVTVSAGVATATDLNSIDAKTTGLVNATAVTGITGIASDVAKALNSIGISHSPSIAVTLSAGTATATDLTLIDSKTTAVVNANAVTTITGTAADIATAISSAGITIAAGVGITIAAGAVTATNLNTIDAKTTAVINATAITSITGLAADIAKAITSVGINNNPALAVTVSAGAVTAANLIAIDTHTTTLVVATAVTSITGTVAEITNVFNSPGISEAPNVGITLSAGTALATDLNTIDSKTTGIVIATAITNVSGSVADVALALGSTGITHAANIGVTITDVTATAADLTLIDSKTTAVISATAVTTLTGSAADLVTVFTSTGIKLNSSIAVTLDAAPATVANLTTIDAKTSTIVDATQITSLTGTAASIASIITSINNHTNTILLSNTVPVIITAGGALAADLVTINTFTTGLIDASLVTAVTGSVADIANFMSSADLKAPNLTVNITSTSASATDLVAIDAATTKTVNASSVTNISGDITSLTNLFKATTVTKAANVNITIDTAGQANVTDLTLLDSKTTGLVDASLIDTITGTAAALKTALTSTGLVVSASAALVVTTPVSVADLNAFNSITSGLITATVSDHTVATLLTLKGVDNAYTITVTDTSVSATNLLSIDALTTVNVIATAVKTITGVAADIASIISSTTILKASNVGVVIGAGTASAADLNTIDLGTTKNVNATAVTLLTGSAADIATAISATTIDTNNSVGVIIDAGVASVADLNKIDANTTAIVNASAITELTGLASDILALNLAKNTLPSDYALTITDTAISINELNYFSTITTGAITATVNGGLASLLTYVPNPSSISANNITFIVTDTTVDAQSLTALSGFTTVNIDASTATTLTGSAADIASLYNSASVNFLNLASITLNSGSVDVADLNSILGYFTGSIDATAVTELVGTTVDIENALINPNITFSQVENIIITDSVTVADLNTLALASSGLITAIVTETDMATLNTFTPANINVANNLYFTVTDASVDAAALLNLASETTVVIDATAVTTFTGSAADLGSLLGSGLVSYSQAINVIVDAGSANAADLNTIQSYLGNSIVDASQVSELTGTIVDIETAIASTGISFGVLPTYAITVADTDFATVTDLNLFSAATSGVITAHVSDTDIATLLTFTPANPNVANNLYFTVTDNSVSAADLLTLMSETTVNIDATAVSTFTGSAADIASVVGSGLVDYIIFLNVSIDAGSASAADLNTIQSYLGIGIVDASQVTELTGTLVDIETAIASTSINFSSVLGVLPTYAITLGDTDFASVTDLNLFSAATSGVITAHVSNNDIASLLSFVPANPATPNNLYFTVTDNSVSAANLLTLMSETTVNIDATAVSTFTGSAADIAHVVSSGTVDYIVFLSATVDAGIANAADLSVIDNNLFLGNVDATAVTEITGSLTDILTDVNSGGITFSSTYNVNVTDTGNLGTLDSSIATTGELILGASSNTAITLNLGTSNFSTIVLDGAGIDTITASTTVLETFVLGAGQQGGTTINGLIVGDAINIDGASAITDLTGSNIGTAGNVISAGEWAFDTSNHSLTYFNSVAGHAETITLTGVNNVTLASGDVFHIA